MDRGVHFHLACMPLCSVASCCSQLEYTKGESKRNSVSPVLAGGFVLDRDLYDLLPALPQA